MTHRDYSAVERDPLDIMLDAALEDSFPASDPVALSVRDLTVTVEMGIEAEEVRRRKGAPLRVMTAKVGARTGLPA